LRQFRNWQWTYNEAIPECISHFELLEELPKGGQARVYKARDSNLGRTVALKLPLLDSKEAESRFLREGRALAALRHDHVVIVFEADRSPQGPYLAMEYLPGGTLRDRIRAAAAKGQRSVFG
jgi:serine/threonine protein kinase